MRLIKYVLAAAAATAIAAPASAAILNAEGGLQGRSDGDGELFWSIIDLEGERSYTRDLGVGLQEFLDGVAAGTTWRIENDATLQTFLGSIATGTPLVWNIGALDGFGIQRFISTATIGGERPLFQNQAIGRFDDNPNIFIGSSNALGPHISNEDGSHIATRADENAYAGAAVWGSNFGGRATGFSNYINVGDSAAMVLFEQSSAAFASRFANGTTTDLKYLGNPVIASFDGSALTIAAIPEPSTYAMLGLGLAAIGFAARRRSAR